MVRSKATAADRPTRSLGRVPSRAQMREMRRRLKEHKRRAQEHPRAFERLIEGGALVASPA